MDDGTGSSVSSLSAPTPGEQRVTTFHFLGVAVALAARESTWLDGGRSGPLSVAGCLRCGHVRRVSRLQADSTL